MILVTSASGCTSSSSNLHFAQLVLYDVEELARDKNLPELTAIVLNDQNEVTDNIVMVPMQQQSGGTDCGVFVIAVMTSLVFDDNPSEITSTSHPL